MRPSRPFGPDQSVRKSIVARAADAVETLDAAGLEQTQQQFN